MRSLNVSEAIPIGKALYNVDDDGVGDGVGDGVRNDPPIDSRSLLGLTCLSRQGRLRVEHVSIT